MAALYPFSNVTAELLKSPPAPGGTHRWLAQVAAGLSEALTRETSILFLRRCCDRFVNHRVVPDQEIEAAVRLAYDGVADQRLTTQDRRAGTDRPSGRRAANYGVRALDWPDADEELIGRTLADSEPLFDGETDTGLTPADVLPGLFGPGELVCAGCSCEKPVIRPLEAALVDAADRQFIVVNPMKEPHGLNQQGRISARCQSNVLTRRFLVAEFDDPTLPKAGQAMLASALDRMAPLVLAVDSGGKSVHAWYRVDGMDANDQARFFSLACTMGADRTRWDTCGWLRMPGGTRRKGDDSRVRQKVLYWVKQKSGKQKAEMDGGKYAGDTIGHSQGVPPGGARGGHRDRSEEDRDPAGGQDAGGTSDTRLRE